MAGQAYVQGYDQPYCQAYEQQYGQASGQVYQANRPIPIKSNEPQVQQSEIKDFEFHSLSKTTLKQSFPKSLFPTKISQCLSSVYQ